ncbi:MAG: hypothetical protein RMJ55_12165 [Roseiflexaceae bacterium]|nr:hypothetical protein [Roseiflexaceae bacterium]
MPPGDAAAPSGRACAASRTCVRWTNRCTRFLLERWQRRNGWRARQRRGHASGAGTPAARARQRRGHASGAGTPPARARHRRGRATAAGHATGVGTPPPPGAPAARARQRRAPTCDLRTGAPAAGAGTPAARARQRRGHASGVGTPAACPYLDPARG